MARQLCCRDMCKNLLRSDGQQQNYSKAKFLSNLNCGQKIVSETGPRSPLEVKHSECSLMTSNQCHWNLKRCVLSTLCMYGSEQINFLNTWVFLRGMCFDETALYKRKHWLKMLNICHKTLWRRVVQWLKLWIVFVSIVGRWISMCTYLAPRLLMFCHQVPLLLTWFNYNLSMEK